MATLVLSAAGAALGGSFGGSLAGLSTMMLGKAAGATLGNVLDQRLLGAGAAPVEAGKVEQFKVMGAGEGAALPRVYGRTRIAGQLIWSSRFREHVSEENVGGKGGGANVKEYSYSISVAVALCEGEVVRVGRIWADGQTLDQSGVEWRLYHGTDDQLPDPAIAAIEGAENAPAYRGTAYVVFENLELGRFGNRIPQFSFEVFRRAEPHPETVPPHPALDVRGVALVPGTGEYSLAAEPVRFDRGRGAGAVVNVNNDRGIPDLVASMDQLAADLPNAKAVSLVVSWFGDDLRCDRCDLYPAVEQKIEDGDSMAWSVSGINRQSATQVSRIDGRPAFGGTPADKSVVQAIQHMNGAGHKVMFYPFILMDIQAENGLINPWTGEAGQPVIPWRGRITLSRAPGVDGSPDKSAAAAAEVEAFFGQAQPGDFTQGDSSLGYHGPAEWSYRRFVLHYAHLCALAGGVEAFCIGSELRSLTQIRDAATGYPVVRALRQLASDVRVILGPDVKIGYAADWSEYFGHHPGDGSGDVLFHLDSLWAHDDIDFIGIDNYMPLSDWRDDGDHLDAHHGSIYDLSYLRNGVAGGEGYDWYYASDEDRAAQNRNTIADTAYGEDWVFRYKDIRNWWSSSHENRLGGVKIGEATEWVPQSKPIWFTEIGCPAVDKGTNQPNVFFDPKSSESFVPYHSSGAKDEFIQYRYLQAMFSHWGDAANNPVSDLYNGPMVDTDRVFVWAWDARPWPDFPARLDTWADGDNYERGHWLNGRASVTGLAEVVAEECWRADEEAVDCDQLHGAVTGFAINGLQAARQSLQPLMLAYGFDAFSVDGRQTFVSRGGVNAGIVAEDRLVEFGGQALVSRTRSPAAESVGRASLTYVRSDMEYASGASEAIAPGSEAAGASQSNLPMVLDEGQARAITDRWLSESDIARETIEFSLPPSELAVTVGDIVRIQGGNARDHYRIDRIDEVGHRQVTAVRVDPALHRAPSYEVQRVSGHRIAASVPPFARFLDLPLLTGDESPHSLHVAISNSPWTGPVAVYGSNADYGYSLNREFSLPATVGELVEPLKAGSPGLWMNSSVLVCLDSGVLQSRSAEDVLNGANAAALGSGDGADWEIIQFTDAELVGPREYRISGFLRGQAGTDAIMPANWPEGTEFVLLDQAVGQLDLPSSARERERHYRIGPTAKPYDSAEYAHQTAAALGIGLRPYAPVHLDGRVVANGDIALTWIRRTRIDGDSWTGPDVPLGEDSESYHVRVVRDGTVMREVFVSEPKMIYSSAEQLQDDATGPVTFEVAQVSGRFGPGPYQRTILNV